MRFLFVPVIGSLALVACSSGGTNSGSGAITGGVATTGGTSAGASSSLWISGAGAASLPSLLTGGAIRLSETCPPLIPLVSAVDGKGNLWRYYSTLEMWTATQLLASCAPGPPQVSLVPDQASYYTASALAFDSEGNLWLSQVEYALPGPSLLGFRAADLTTSGNVSPTWGIQPATGDCQLKGSLCNPFALAFDKAGFLWMSNSYSVLAYSPTTLKSAAVAKGVLTTTLADEQISAPDAGPLAAYFYGSLAFDHAGNLWATVSGVASQIVEFSSAELGNLVSDDQPAPIFSITYLPSNDPSFQWGQIAFDADGNLWASTTETQPNLFRFSTASLAAGGLPDIADTVPLDPSMSLAFSPIPAGLPIQP